MNESMTGLLRRTKRASTLHKQIVGRYNTSEKEMYK